MILALILTLTLIRSFLSFFSYNIFINCLFKRTTKKKNNNNEIRSMYNAIDKSGGLKQAFLSFDSQQLHFSALR